MYTNKLHCYYKKFLASTIRKYNIEQPMKNMNKLIYNALSEGMTMRRTTVSEMAFIVVLRLEIEAEQICGKLY